jgi:hypothetical protein
MEMRDGNQIDGLWIDAGGEEIGAKHAGGCGDLSAGAGIDQNEILPRIDDQRRVSQMGLIEVGRIPVLLFNLRNTIQDQL